MYINFTSYRAKIKVQGLSVKMTQQEYRPLFELQEAVEGNPVGKGRPAK